MVHAATALVRHDVAGPERAEFLGLFERYRDEIVEGGKATVWVTSPRHGETRGHRAATTRSAERRTAE